VPITQYTPTSFSSGKIDRVGFSICSDLGDSPKSSYSFSNLTIWVVIDIYFNVLFIYFCLFIFFFFGIYF